MTRINKVLRLNNEAALAKLLLGYLIDRRIVEAISGDIHPPYNEDMRKFHVNMIKAYIQQHTVVENVATPTPAMLTAELLEAAYTTAFHVRPASSYTDL